MKEAILILFGFVLAFVPNWLDRKRKLRAHWHAINAELSLIEEKADAYIDHGIMAPLYRLPHKTYDSSFQMLLTEGAITGEEVISIERFYDLVKDINRGLDQIQEYLVQDNKEGINREYSRNKLKVLELNVGTSEAEALKHAVINIVKIKCNLKLVQY